MTPLKPTLVDPNQVARARRRLKWRGIRAARRADIVRDKDIAQTPRVPQDYGLTAAERLSHGRGLRNDHGWSVAEIRVTLTDPGEVSAA